MFHDVWIGLAWGIGVLLEHVLGSTSEGFQWCLQSMLVLFQKLELVFPPKISKVPIKTAKVWFLDVFGIHWTIFFGKLEKETSHITWHIRDILGFLAPRTCRGGTAEEAVQKSAEHIRRKEICLEGCSGVKGDEG